MKNKKMNNKGFSLVELIIVIAIMAVLVAVLAPQYMRFVERGRAESDRTNYEAVVSALQVHAVDTMATNALSDGTITINRTGDTTISDAAQVEALVNASIGTVSGSGSSTTVTIPGLTNQSTFTSVTITITTTGGNITVTATETT